MNDPIEALYAHIDSIDYAAPGAITDPDDPRLFTLPALPDGDFLSPDEWAELAGLVAWRVHSRPNSETVVVTLDQEDWPRYAYAIYVAGEVIRGVYADAESRDAALREAVI